MNRADKIEIVCIIILAALAVFLYLVYHANMQEIERLNALLESGEGQGCESDINYCTEELLIGSS